MAAIIEHEKYVAVDPTNNNNKFWEYSVYDDNTIEYKWGRIGKTTQSQKKALNRKELEKKIHEKLNKRESDGPPYTKIDIVHSGPTGASGPSTKIENVKEAAVRDIAGSCPILSSLVKKLAEANKHELFIASGGQMNVDLSTGLVTTPLGIVGQQNITTGRTLLAEMQPFIQKQDFEAKEFHKVLGDYLRLIPQAVAAKRGWHRTFLTSDADLQRQAQLLDQLETSIGLAAQRVKDAEQAALADKGLVERPKSFNVKLAILDSAEREYKRLVDFYNKTINTVHASSRLKVTKIFSVEIDSMKKAFDADGGKMPEIWELFHGTRTVNALSILKQGLIIPKTSGTSIQIAGRMFGDGLYFSDQSSKSANYSQGYWGGGGRDNQCYMFIADVAMGKHYTPSGPHESFPKPGYDSTFAKGGHSRVMNNEMIVYRTSQANLKYLLELTEH